MNLIIYSICILFIAGIHYTIFNFSPTKTNKINTEPVVKPHFVNIKMASYSPPKPQKIIEKTEPIKKETISKTIEKKVVKKKIEKPKKIVKESKKPAKQKVVKQKKIIKKEKVVKKVVETKKEPTKEIITKKNQEDINKKELAQKQKLYKNRYLQELKLAIEKNKKYPNISRRINEQGKVTISFRILKSGKFENMKVLTSSGKKRLDKAALNAVETTNSFKPISKELQVSFLDIKLPMQFRLQ